MLSFSASPWQLRQMNPREYAATGRFFLALMDIYVSYTNLERYTDYINFVLFFVKSVLGLIEFVWFGSCSDSKSQLI